MYITDPREDWAVDLRCGEFVCTGLKNVLIIDEDGSLTRNGIPSAVTPINTGVASAHQCTARSAMNCYFCIYNSGAEARYASLVFESLDSDGYTRTISPVYITGMEVDDAGYTVHEGGADT